MFGRKALAAIAVPAVVAIGLGTAAQALDRKPILTLELANKIADACEAA